MTELRRNFSSFFRLPSVVLVASVFAVPVSAAPTINAIANAASNITFNAPLAQGSIFIIKGTGLGPANISIASTPFQSTTLSGTSVAVTVGNTTVNAPMYYTSDGQVAALLPSTTPTGTGMFVVTYNGQASGVVGHGIVASNVGIFTIDSSGQGPAIVTYPDYSLVSSGKAANCGGPNTACGAANPGDTLIIWATGMGPVSGNELTGSGLGTNMPNVPLTLWLGGVQVAASYQGRSGCCVGEDEIVFKVPNNTPIGCAVPLAIQVGSGANTISNTTALPVANGSRTCPITNTALASVNVEDAVLNSTVTFGSVRLNHFTNPGSPPTFEDDGNFQFFRITSYAPGSQPFFTSFLDSIPPGTCAAYANLNPGQNTPITGVTPLDAGSSFTVKGPNGSVTVAGTPGQFKPQLNATGTFLVPGAYTVTGGGGADVGPFNGAITFPAVPTLTSPVNPAAAVRANGLQVSWSGGDPNGNVEIDVFGATDNTFTLGDTAICIAPAKPGTFTIPPYVLLSIVPTNFGGLVLSPADVTAPFTASGLSLGVLTMHNDGNSVALVVK